MCYIMWYKKWLRKQQVHSSWCKVKNWLWRHGAYLGVTPLPQNNSNSPPSQRGETLAKFQKSIQNWQLLQLQHNEKPISRHVNFQLVTKKITTFLNWFGKQKAVIVVKGRRSQEYYGFIIFYPTWLFVKFKNICHRWRIFKCLYQKSNS